MAEYLFLNRCTCLFLRLLLTYICKFFQELEEVDDYNIEYKNVSQHEIIQINE